MPDSDSGRGCSPPSPGEVHQPSHCCSALEPSPNMMLETGSDKCKAASIMKHVSSREVYNFILSVTLNFNRWSGIFRPSCSVSPVMMWVLMMMMIKGRRIVALNLREALQSPDSWIFSRMIVIDQRQFNVPSFDNNHIRTLKEDAGTIWTVSPGGDHRNKHTATSGQLCSRSLVNTGGHHQRLVDNGLFNLLIYKPLTTQQTSLWAG